MSGSKNPPKLDPLPIPNFSYHQPASYSGGSVPQSPGYTQGGSGSSGGTPTNTYLGAFDGPGNPNTEFNFNIGQFWDGSVTGHSGNKGGEGPNTSPNAAPGPANYDFNQWTWEQILNEVLNLNIPDRNVIGALNNPNLRWTTVESNTSGDGGRIYIYGVTWGSNHQDTLTYLSTWLQTPGNPWDVFLNGPYQALYESETGNLAAYSTALDPSSFAGPIYALQGVEGFYANAATSLNAFVNDLTGDQSAFQGQAGGAFAQLIWDLWDQANQISTQMGAPGAAGAYDQQLLDSMQAAETFLNSIWNAYADWTNVMEHSPLGAILRALIARQVVVGTPGQWTTNPNMSPSDTPFGDLSTDAGWQSVENLAKQLWLNQINALDSAGRAALLNLAGSYYGTQQALQAITTIPPAQITPGNPNFNMGGGGAGPNINMPPIDVAPPNVNIPAFPNIPGFPNFNMPNFNFPPSAFASMAPMAPNTNVPAGFNTGNDGLSALADLANSGFGGIANLVNSGFGGIANLANSGLGGLADLANSGFGGLANLANSGFGGVANLTNSGLGGLINGLGGIGNGGPVPTLGGNQTAANLGNALTNSDQTQAALRQALASGLVPSSGPLSREIARALGSNGQVQSILNRALSGGTPSSTGLQTALADNAETQAALEKALALAPAHGPLHNVLEQALAHSRATEKSIKQTLASIAPAGGPVNHALSTDGSLQSALRRVMLTGQIPSSGVLHDSMHAAMAESAKLKNALDQLAAGGAVPSHAAVHRAMTDNLALQKELNRALASGQVPSTGPLHDDLERALSQSVKLGGELHQALAGFGIVAEPGIGLRLGNQALTGGLGGPGQPLIAPPGLGGQGVAVPGGVQMPGGGAGAAGVPGGAAAAAAGLGPGNAGPGLGSTGPVSSGAFVLPGAVTEAGSAASELPLYPPMAGMGMGGMGMGQTGMGQERERTTWLSEDEDVWGAQPEDRPPQVLGRDVDDDDLADYDLDELPDRGPAERDRRGGPQRGHLR